MNILQRHKSVLFAFMVMILMPLAALLLNNCGGSDSYTVSDAQQGTVQVMISPATLNSWAENGYGTDSSGYNKLVVLDVDSASGYAAGHIPGSYNLDTGSDLYTTRSNGVSFTVSQVATKEMMDALIQRTGIDANSVVALVGNGTMMNVGRAYFNFRYWGFPKARLRVLNGTKNATYRDADGYDLSNVATPLPTPSTYSVAELTPDVSVRASLEEMIGVAQDSNPFTVIIDSRSENEYNGVTRSTKVTSSVPTYVAFEGHINTAEHQEFTTLQVGNKSSNPLLSEAELRTAMAAINVNEDTTGISYCRTSWRATMQFLALDAVLGWKAKIYDGAWIEWGQMASNATYDGSLDPDSPWRTDIAGISSPVKYNKTTNIEPIVGANSSAPNANLINITDKTVCGPNPPVAPPDRAVDVMISPATLLGWVDGGYNDPENYGYTKIVVLHVDSGPGYESGHVPGAFHLNTTADALHPVVDLSATRNNGIADTVSQVATKEMMDALIQRTGIDAGTVIVFTTGSGAFNQMNLGRAYFNFRYWGFPKERLRIMDGNTTIHYAAVDDLVTATPAPVASAYSVCNLRQDTSVDQVRASFEEMFAVAADSDPDTVVADARSLNEYNGVAGSTTVTGRVPTYVAFEGHVKTAQLQEYSTLLTSDGRLIPEADLLVAMNAIGANDTTTVYTYCRTSWRAAVNFMALDAVLGWPVKIYDGAWIQWGQMATKVMYDGSLDPASPWRTDNSSHSVPVTYNNDVIIEQVGTNSYAPHANLINTEDAGTATTGGGGSGGGGSSQPEAPGYN